jgi:hypothetical protein
MNSIVLMLMQEKNGWQTSRYATFDRIVSLNFTKDKDGKKAAVDENGNKLPRVGINKGEKSTPVMLTTFTCVHKETKEHIKYDDYKQLTQDERNNYNVYPKLQVYNVFNLDQTNLKEARPEMYQKFKDEAVGQSLRTTEGMVDFPALDAMIEKDLYVCPIKPIHGDNAFYSINKDEIVIPEKAQFIDGESHYLGGFQSTVQISLRVVDDGNDLLGVFSTEYNLHFLKHLFKLSRTNPTTNLAYLHHHGCWGSSIRLCHSILRSSIFTA